MKPMSVGEKFGMIRYHGEQLSRTNLGRADRRSDIIESAQRIIELVKSIPKAEMAPED